MKSMTHRIVRHATLLFMLCVLSACTTVEQRQAASDRVNGVWGADNQKTRATLGNRTVVASSDQVLLAAQRALGRIGISVIATDRKSGRITAQRQYANAAWSWSDAVRQAEEPRLKQIFVETIGPQGAFLALTPKDEVLSATLSAERAGSSRTRVTIDFRSDNSAGTTCQGGCVTEMPPAALRAALYEFWRAFDEELSAVRATARTPARNGRPGTRNTPDSTPPTRAPSDWVLPPSNWVLPPSG